MTIDRLSTTRDRSIPVSQSRRPSPSQSEEPAPLVSFIVCTRDRAEALEACIRSIESACRSHPAVTSELIVVDNGSTDNTPECLASIAAAADMTMVLVTEARPGLAVARNTGLQRARGQILVFIDDDCEIDGNYLNDLQKHYAGGERSVLRGGRVELGNSRDLPFTIKLSRKVERLTCRVHPGGFVLGCNMTMHREVAALVGSFDERLGAGASMQSAEDTDYVLRAFQLGIPVEYVPDMTVYHHHGRRSRQEIEKLHRSYSFGNGGLYVKHARNTTWLLRHFYWTVRSACMEPFGGPKFNPEVGLSHWPIVFMNLLGAIKFAGLLLTGQQQQTKVSRVEQVTPSSR